MLQNFDTFGLTIMAKTGHNVKNGFIRQEFETKFAIFRPKNLENFSN